MHPAPYCKAGVILVAPSVCVCVFVCVCVKKLNKQPMGSDTQLQRIHIGKLEFREGVGNCMSDVWVGKLYGGNVWSSILGDVQEV